MANKFKKCLISLAVILSALTSCSGEQKSQDVLLNGFETVDDLYNVRQLMSNISYDVRAKLEINTDANYIKTGNGSLKVNHKTSECSSIFQRIDTTPILDGRDISDIAKLSAWVYNDTDETLPVILSVVGQEQTILTSHNDKVLSKQWALITFNINKVVIDYNYKQIQGFSIGFDRTSPITCYVDDFKLSFGSEYTEEDKKVMSTVESLNQRMAAIPESIAVTDTATIEEARQIGLAYETIPEIYRIACTNYSRYQSALSSYVQAYSTDYATESTVNALFFGSIFGLSQVSLGSRTQTFPLSYSEEMKYADEVGSLKATITDNTLDWWIFDATAPFQLGSYKYFEMNVYPDTNCDLSMSVSWDGGHTLKPKQWNKVHILCADFPEGTTSKLEIEFTGLDEKGASIGFLGNVYFANAILVRNSAKDFANLVNTLLPIDDLTYDDRLEVERIFDYYYNLDINEQGKQVAIEALIILNAARNKVLSEGKTLLPGKIAALPDNIANFKVYQCSLVEECMEIYEVMTDEEKSSLADRQKLLDLNIYSTSNFGVVYTPNDELLNYSVFRGTTDVVEVKYDETYGKIFHCSSSDCFGGMAFNFSFKGLDEYSEIRFFVSSKEWTRFGLFATPWWSTAYDFDRGIIIDDLLNTQFTINNNIYYECVISVDDFVGMNYFMFNTLVNGTTTNPVDATITPFYGVKK